MISTIIPATTVDDVIKAAFATVRPQEEKSSRADRNEKDIQEIDQEYTAAQVENVDGAQEEDQNRSPEEIAGRQDKNDQRSQRRSATPAQDAPHCVGTFLIIAPGPVNAAPRMQLPIHSESPTTTGLLGLSVEELSAALDQMGEKPYRAKQVREWIFTHGVTSFDEMTNLSKALRTKLAERFHVYESTIVAESASADGTRKLLLGWRDGATSECVLIPDDPRRTACISTQVGCPVGCVFCASGLDGLARNLTAAQIVEQAMRIRGLCDEAMPLSNIVFMGLGEPLANYRNTVAALRIINGADGLNIGARKITISTVGLPKQMRQLADEGLQITLALSLHAPSDELRAQLIPWAESVSIKELVDAARYYFDRTGREITLEYVLLGGVNDSVSNATNLARLCRTMRANVNLIRYNPVPDLPYERPKAEAAQAFLETLRERGVNTHLRRSRGQDIEGACGQLRRRMSQT